MAKKRRFVLFDLDGTLIPMARQQFEPAFRQAVDDLFRTRFPGLPAAEGMWAAAERCSAPNGDHRETNQARFSRALGQELGERARDVLQALEEYYAGDYNRLKGLLRGPSIAEEALGLTQRYGGIPVLATNPNAPASCIYARMAWVGMTPEQFRLVTTSELCHYNKPDPAYFREVLELLGAETEECVMVGNDVQEDMWGARQAGIRAFLLTDCLMDRDGTMDEYPNGDSLAMLRFLTNFLTR